MDLDDQEQQLSSKDGEDPTDPKNSETFALQTRKAHHSTALHLSGDGGAAIMWGMNEEIVNEEIEADPDNATPTPSPSQLSRRWLRSSGPGKAVMHRVANGLLKPLIAVTGDGSKKTQSDDSNPAPSPPSQPSLRRRRSSGRAVTHRAVNSLLKSLIAVTGDGNKKTQFDDSDDSAPAPSPPLSQSSRRRRRSSGRAVTHRTANSLLKPLIAVALDRGKKTQPDADDSTSSSSTSSSSSSTSWTPKTRKVRHEAPHSSKHGKVYHVAVNGLINLPIVLTSDDDEEDKPDDPKSSVAMSVPQPRISRTVGRLNLLHC